MKKIRNRESSSILLLQVVGVSYNEQRERLIIEYTEKRRRFFVGIGCLKVLSRHTYSPQGTVFF